MNLLVINPNTSVSLSQRLQQHVTAVIAALEGEAQVRTTTAAFGASYICDEASFAIAAHAALDAAATDCALQGLPDALLLGCFGDPGIDALRELTGRPVVGLAEASMHAAATRGRFAVVTGGAAWKPILERLARTLGWGEALTAVHVVEASGAQLAADPTAAIGLLRDLCRKASAGADAVILGGAGLAGMAGQIAPSLDVPLIDSVTAGAQALLHAARAGTPPAPRSRSAAAPIEWQRLSTQLRQRLG
jgi:allantoin racemase